MDTYLLHEYRQAYHAERLYRRSRNGVQYREATRNVRAWVKNCAMHLYERLHPRQTLPLNSVMTEAAPEGVEESEAA